MNFPDHPFWDFALGVYSSEGVPEACINLQERLGMDVNVMLFCLWIGHSGQGALSEDEVLAVLAATDKWHRVVVKGLRLVRRTLKEGFDAAPEELRTQLRAEVQAVEIDAERLQQLMLVTALNDRRVNLEDAPLEERAGDAVAGLGHYLQAIDAQFEPRDAVDFAHILGKSFADLKPDSALDLSENLM